MSEAMQFLLVVGMAGAVYGGIRQDIKAIHASIREAVRSTKRAHKRIDRLTADRRKGAKC